ncbi:MAG: hypothetical protein OJK14_15610, partial [Achromobacter sp.]|uniref:hypothetical protein n=1 Tax=Achromobacter sp. TaxID=134375 RepID=UPI0025887D7D
MTAEARKQDAIKMDKKGKGNSNSQKDAPKTAPKTVGKTAAGKTAGKAATADEAVKPAPQPAAPEAVKDVAKTSGAEPGMTRAILDAVPHPLFTIAGNGHVVEANVAAEAFFEVSAPLLRRRPL